ncbi:hypothetical protein AS594_36130 [Streptomyces agglomeratus]|uniref:Chromosome partitioning protein n=1 Tax=Streptomyces agglomeratus TaxID=285458 RepID=A0A1E5PHQ5_9ACTN|nr:hypothetical protein [Streptomyces agglomeratus]OEJ29036.1 hypothetical protein AS594_36130 [Streptomyces agglomeratus]
MAVIALVSGKSSGVTCSALALALASPRPSLLVEADPAGGTVRAGYLAGEGSAAFGMHRLAAADRQSTLAREFAQHFVSLDRDHTGNRMLLPGLTDPSQAPSLARTWDQIATLLGVMDQSGYDVIIDAGRIIAESETRLSTTAYPTPMLRRADAVLLVVRTTQASITSAAPAVRILREELSHNGTGADALGLLLIEEGSFSSSNVQQELQTPVIGMLAWDPDTADVFTHGNYKRTPKALLRSARTALEGPINELVTRRRVQLRLAGVPAVAGRAS